MSSILTCATRQRQHRRDVRGFRDRPTPQFARVQEARRPPLAGVDGADGLLFVVYYGFILLVATNKALLARRIGEVTTLGIPLGVAVIVAAWVLTAALRRLGEPPVRPGRAAAARGVDHAGPAPTTVDRSLCKPRSARRRCRPSLFFLVIVVLTLAITWWAAKRTKSTSEFYAAGRSDQRRSRTASRSPATT